MRPRFGANTNSTHSASMGFDGHIQSQSSAFQGPWKKCRVFEAMRELLWGRKTRYRGVSTPDTAFLEQLFSNHGVAFLQLFCAASLEHGFPAFFPGLPFFFGSFFLGKQKERTRRQDLWMRGCRTRLTFFLLATRQEKEAKRSAGRRNIYS
jgi:hypothetical protein